VFVIVWNMEFVRDLVSKVFVAHPNSKYYFKGWGIVFFFYRLSQTSSLIELSSCFFQYLSNDCNFTQN
jgi:hypothetical protein